MVPQKILDRLLPVLAKADPEEFKFPVAKVAKNPARLPDGKSIDFFSTTFEPTIGKIYRLTVTRDGEVSYLNINRSLIGRADISNVTKYWTICKKDAAILLDGLVEDGLLRGAPDGGEATKLYVSGELTPSVVG